jgi:hypothetical protein
MAIDTTLPVAPMTTGKKPDFVCIGPEKTGTTWLYSVLRDHPQVYLPPTKELRFLDEGGLIPTHNLRRLFFSRHWHYADIRDRLWRVLRRSLGRDIADPKWRKDLRWHLLYILGRRSFDWYDKLFAAAGSQMAGDISPLYYHIPESRIRELAVHNPAVKVLVFVRDPVERAWSKAKMNLMKHKGQSYDMMPREVFFETFDDIQKAWISYRETIAAWRRHFRDVFVGLFDDLQEDPESFYCSVCRFLGIENAPPRNDRLKTVVNKGIRLDAPEEYRAYLFAQYEAEIMEWCSPGSEPAVCRWQDRYEVNPAESGSHRL